MNKYHNVDEIIKTICKTGVNMTLKKTKAKKKTLTMPPIPIGHLNIQQFEELREQVERITGHKMVLVITDKKTKKTLGSL